MFTNMCMFGHSYTKRDNEVLRYLYLQGITVHVTATNADW